MGAIHVVAMGQPEVYLSWKDEQYDCDDNVVSESTLTDWVDHFAQWVDRMAASK
jgi:chromate reductase